MLSLKARDSTKIQSSTSARTLNRLRHFNTRISLPVMVQAWRKDLPKAKSLIKLLRTNPWRKTTFEENVKNFRSHLRVRGYPDNLVNKVLAEVKFTERKLVSLGAVFWMSRNARMLRESKKRLPRRLQESRLLKKRIKLKRIKMPFVTQYNPSVPNPKIF